MQSDIRKRIMSERQQLTEQGEPLQTVERSVNADGRDGLKHTIPVMSQDLMEVSDKDNVKIDIYQDGYVVRKA